MNFKHTILCTAAVSGLLLGVSAFAPAPFSMVSVAQADTSISVNFGIGTFYDQLEPYGNWVYFEDRYVFVPQHVNSGWRPYTLGHWSYTKRYGWLWVSDERFGWATYHYGRWGHSREIGWYWVPGRRWAPAWVAWSHGNNEIAWAPLPPRRGNDIDIDVSITIGDVPDYYWQAVPTSAFLSINLADNVIRDRNQVRTIVQQSTPQTVIIENNIVINNVIQVNEIEKATNTKVEVLQEKAVTTPDAAGKIEANSVAIFNPEVKVDTNAKPKKAVKVEEVVTARKAEGIQPEDVPADQPAANAPKLDKNGKPIAPTDQPPAATPTLDKNGKPIATPEQPAAKVQVPADAKANPDAPAVVKQDKTGTEPLKPADTQKPAEKPAEVATPEVKTPGKVEENKTLETKPVVTQPPAKAAPAVVAPVVKPKKEQPAATPPAAAGKMKKVVPDAVVPQDTQTQPKQTDEQPIDPKQNKKKKKVTGESDEQPVDQNATPPADDQTPPADANAKQKPAKKDEKGKAKCDPNVETCPPAQ